MATTTYQGVSQCNGTSVDVDVVKGQAQLLHRVCGLRGEGLVDLEQVNVLQVEASLLLRGKKREK